MSTARPTTARTPAVVNAMVTSTKPDRRAERLGPGGRGIIILRLYVSMVAPIEESRRPLRRDRKYTVTCNTVHSAPCGAGCQACGAEIHLGFSSRGLPN